MAKHEFTLICSKALIDKTSNNLSLVEIISELEVNTSSPKGEFFDNYFPLEMATSFVRSDPDVLEGEFLVKFNYYYPDGKKGPRPFESKMDLLEGSTTRQILKIPRLRLKDSGNYRFTIQTKEANQSRWKKAGEAVVKININHFKS